VTDRYEAQPGDDNAQLAERLRHMEEKIAALEGVPLVGSNLTALDASTGNVLVVAGVLPDGKHGFLVQNSNGRILFRVAAEDGQTAPIQYPPATPSTTGLLSGAVNGFRPGTNSASGVSLWACEFWSVGPKIDYNFTAFANGGNMNWAITCNEVGGAVLNHAVGSETTNVQRTGTFTISPSVLVAGTGSDPAGRRMRLDFVAAKNSGASTVDIQLNAPPRNYGP